MFMGAKLRQNESKTIFFCFNLNKMFAFCYLFVI